MASTHVYDQVKALLQAGMAGVPVFDWDQIDPSPPPQTQQGVNFLVLDEEWGDARKVAIGDPAHVCEREEAYLVVHCLVPAPQSSATARAFAEQVRAVLHDQNVANLRVMNVAPPALELMNDGLWTAALLSIEVQYDYFVAIP